MASGGTQGWFKPTARTKTRKWNVKFGRLKQASAAAEDFDSQLPPSSVVAVIGDIRCPVNVTCSCVHFQRHIVPQCVNLDCISSSPPPLPAAHPQSSYKGQDTVPSVLIPSWAVTIPVPLKTKIYKLIYVLFCRPTPEQETGGSRLGPQYQTRYCHC